MAKSMNELAHKSPLILSGRDVLVCEIHTMLAILSQVGWFL